MLAPTLMKLTSTGVYHTIDIPKGCKPLDPTLPIRTNGDGPGVRRPVRLDQQSTTFKLHPGECRLLRLIM